MVQRPLQAGPVVLQKARVQALTAALDLFLGLRWALAEQLGAEHRRQGQGHQQGDQHRRRQGHGELAEQATRNPAQQQQGNKYRHQRQAHRQHGKAHLAGALEGRWQGCLAGLDAPGDVLQHDDGVVDDKAGGNDQRHQRQVVEAEIAQVHDHEGADQRHRHGHTGD